MEKLQTSPQQRIFSVGAPMIETLKTTDFDELTTAQAGWEVHHQPVRPEKFEAHLSIGCIGSVQVTKSFSN